MRLARKIPLWLTLTVTVMGVFLAVWMHLAVTAVAFHQSRSAALDELSLAESALSGGAPLPADAQLDDPTLPSDLAARVATGDRASWMTSSSPLVWAAQRLPHGHVLSITVPWSEQADVVNGLDHAIVVGLGTSVLVAVALSLALSLNLTRRFSAAERAARRIAAGELDVRVTHAVGGRDEMALLGRTIDQLAESMQQRLDLEKRVTADIAHDLRTPVTGLVTAASLLGQGRAEALVQRQAARLRELVEDVIEVARLDHGEADVDPVPVSTAVLARTAASAASRPVEVVVREDDIVHTDPRRVQRILVNLVENALCHGRPPVHVIADGAVLTVRDHGDGYSEDLLDSGPQRFSTGAPARDSGHGLGLTIAVGQARVIGAQLTFANADDGGACARLRLVAPPMPMPSRRELRRSTSRRRRRRAG